MCVSNSEEGACYFLNFVGVCNLFKTITGMAKHAAVRKGLIYQARLFEYLQLNKVHMIFPTEEDTVLFLEQHEVLFRTAKQGCVCMRSDEFVCIWCV